MLQHFRNRDDVIRFAMDHLPRQYRSVARSFEDGKVEFLGGFKGSINMPSGWMIKITSRFNKTSHLFIYADSSNQFRLAIRTMVDWKFWDGDKSDNPLYQGDNPERYKALKIAAIENE